jgi:single-stranded-DNA-specific exonuclease
VYSLAPFGSGNAEPKFVLENLRVITSNVAGEKHIKNILSGKDGSTIRTIAFNAVNTPLEGFLNKNNKKSFNAAGKMSLNEWQGKKNIEFVIEDISLN